MDENQIRDYVLKYKNSYSKEQIISQLKSAGATDDEINLVYSKLNGVSENVSDIKTKKGKAKLGFFLILIGLFIPLLGFILIIYGLVLGFKSRRISKDGFSLFVIIFGFISLILGIAIQLMVVGFIMYSFVDFDALLPNKVDMSSTVIMPIVGDSFASEDGTIIIAFRYNGVKPIEMDLSSAYFINYNYGDSNCTSVSKIYNGEMDSSASFENPIGFRNGQSGYIRFDNCQDFDEMDVVEGEMKLEYINTQIGDSVPVYGDIRLIKIK